MVALRVVIIFLGLTLTPWCCAEGAGFPALGFPLSPAQLSELGLKPVKTMDNATLFRSAAAMRDTSIPPEQRLLNNLWLRQDESDTVHGGRALTTLLKLGFISYRRAEARQESTQDKNPDDEQTRSALITHLGHYSLRLSRDRVRLQVTYEF